jgi:hypothetical protein
MFMQQQQKETAKKYRVRHVAILFLFYW